MSIPFTDDTKMATILLKHYTKYQMLKKDILLNEYKYWAKTQGNQKESF
jgi:ADP-ribosylglycohydrolase